MNEHRIPCTRAGCLIVLMAAVVFYGSIYLLVRLL